MSLMLADLFHIWKMNPTQLDVYFREKRKRENSQNIIVARDDWRRRIHPLFIAALKIDRLMKKEKLVVFADHREPHQGGAIYAVTHIGGNDVERSFEVIGEHAYIMFGDPGIFYKCFDGIAIQANGWVPLDTRDAEDRKIAYKRSLERLRQGKNLLIFPEGAFNVFENLPVMHLFPGAVKLAKETGCDIIPVALEQYENTFFAVVGKNMKVPKTMDYKEANRRLRDRIASMKWRIWETQGVQRREQFSKAYAEGFRESVVNKVVHKGYSYTLQDIYYTMYHTPR